MCPRYEYRNEPCRIVSFFGRGIGHISEGYGTQPALRSVTALPYPSRLIGTVPLECSDLWLIGKKTLNINILAGVVEGDTKASSGIGIERGEHRRGDVIGEDKTD